MQPNLHGFEFQKYYKVGISKLCLSVVFNYYFINYYFTILERFEFKLYFYYLCKQSPFCQVHKILLVNLIFILKIWLLLVYNVILNFIKPLQLLGSHLILKCKIYEEIKKAEKKREKKK
jgi:hypothetical protein